MGRILLGPGAKCAGDKCPIFIARTCLQNYAVERWLVVGFCGQPLFFTDPTTRQPGFDLPRHTLSVVNRFRTGQGPCRANLHKWGLAQSPSCVTVASDHLYKAVFTLLSVPSLLLSLPPISLRSRPFPFPPSSILWGTRPPCPPRWLRACREYHASLTTRNAERRRFTACVAQLMGGRRTSIPGRPRLWASCTHPSALVTKHYNLAPEKNSPGRKQAHHARCIGFAV